MYVLNEKHIILHLCYQKTKQYKTTSTLVCLSVPSAFLMSCLWPTVDLCLMKIYSL